MWLTTGQQSVKLLPVSVDSTNLDGPSEDNLIYIGGWYHNSPSLSAVFISCALPQIYLAVAVATNSVQCFQEPCKALIPSIPDSCA